MAAPVLILKLKLNFRGQLFLLAIASMKYIGLAELVDANACADYLVKQTRFKIGSSGWRKFNGCC